MFGVEVLSKSQPLSSNGISCISCAKELSAPEVVVVVVVLDVWSEGALN